MAEKVKQYRLPDDPITLDELKSFLWAAATHLRGQIDAVRGEKRCVSKFGRSENI